MEKESSFDASVALIVGVTGMVGFNLAEALKKTNPLGSPWKVYGIARRPLPSWFPPTLIDSFISLDALDLKNTTEKLSPIANEITHVFWVARQVHQSEEANISMNTTMLANILDVLKSASPSRLKHVSLQTGAKHYIGPIFDPSLTDDIVHQEPPFTEDVNRLPYPNFYYALEDLVASYSPSFTYSIHRPTTIIGASTNSEYNSLITLSVYATICRYQGLPFRFPGSRYTWEHFFDMSDASLLAEQQIWAAVTDKAKNQAFNCVNGDFLTWKTMWKVLCEVFDIEFLDFDDENGKFDWIEVMKDKGKVWDEIVEKHGLLKTKMEDITNFEGVNAALHFGFQIVCSMTKGREFGFFGYANSVKRIRFWVGRLREMKIIP